MLPGCEALGVGGMRWMVEFAGLGRPGWQADQAPSGWQAFVFAVERPSADGRQAGVRRRAAWLTWPSPSASAPSLTITLLIEGFLGGEQPVGEAAGVSGQRDPGLDRGHATAAVLAVALRERW
jgi:hypothetical protein